MHLLHLIKMDMASAINLAAQIYLKNDQKKLFNQISEWGIGKCFSITKTDERNSNVLEFGFGKVTKIPSLSLFIILPSLVSSAEFIRKDFIFSTRSLIKILNNTGPFG